MMEKYAAELQQPVSHGRVHEIVQSLSDHLCHEVEARTRRPGSNAVADLARCQEFLLLRVTEACCSLMEDHQVSAETVLGLLQTCCGVGAVKSDPVTCKFLQ